MHRSLSYIDPQAKLARNVVVEPFVTIEKNVEIGSGTWIGSNVTIMEGARIGLVTRPGLAQIQKSASILTWRRFPQIQSDSS